MVIYLSRGSYLNFHPESEFIYRKLCTMVPESCALLIADTEYDIILKGEGADFIRIKFGHVFETLKSPVYTGSPSSEFVYRIKTSPDFDDRIYINVVPLHKDGNGFIREHPQAFFLPN